MPRYDICDGDTTTAGGRVIASRPNDTLRGRAIAYEYDPVWCPKCNTTGQILCATRRYDTGPNMQQAALSGDWCLCKCKPHPLLISRQQESFTS
ncbi:hypothetical protein LMG28614_03202 [Paraburkholderia ultramafica]|uniref:PAAR domain-containing protein n=1 Tax=Paraburkholderia ultramafica TaxID=1544867 RepID=A0A6S7BNG1_9BURK|nr:PAAR domain-containing protein [Paraburkholderia ultramafica]CAB3790947.1 hypothetical protein LMG28614_03202 [Paraburkholderia ultramafica]